MITDEQRFVWDVDSLQEIAKNPHQKNLLDASVILRRILTDSAGPLVHRISKKTGLKLQFQLFSNSGKSDLEAMLNSMPGKKGSLTAMYLNPDPSIVDNPNTRGAGLDEFLATQITYFDGKYLTVKEIINYVANVGGGVHLGQPTKRDNAETIHRTANTMWMNGKPYPLENIRNIINIALSGLLPQYERLRA